MKLRTTTFEAEHKDGNVLLTLPVNTVFAQNIDRVTFKMIQHAALNLFTEDQKRDLLESIRGELE
ncbi:MAG: hypothetical protein CMI54_01630 [Parcubacteria group bacterium]|nr:hypothetical protein [Parcubacteria group bacterium]|tara:strand:+ start:24358 stop:24552 length:195 start_codon:yes stop_codon:yes gene_type:complete